jgi:glycosyltransferase involved in cell wall biosynthesis
MYDNTLCIVTPCKSSVNGKFMTSINQILTSGLSHELGMNVLFDLSLGKSNIVHARSILLSKWFDKSKDGDLFLFIDSDHVFTKGDIIAAVKLKECDIACGIYCNATGEPNAYAMNLDALLDNMRDNRLYYAGTGFMLIRRSICVKMLELIRELDGDTRFAINADTESNIIPFFRTRFIEPEANLSPRDKKHWLGEDYSFCWMVRQCGGVIRGFLSYTLGHEVLNVRHFYPDNYKTHTRSNGSIVYICGNSAVKFDPTCTDLGGSEKAVIELCKRWKSNPNVTDVTVFGNVNEGVYNGVEYRSFEKINMDEQYDTVILWRRFGCQVLPHIKANKIMIDLHDCSKMYPELIRMKVDKVFMKSGFHRSLNKDIPDNKVCIIPNGIEDDVLNAAKSYKITKRYPKRFIYASCYTRGLEKILKHCWPIIRKNVPDAELHCFYGMELCNPTERNMFEKLFRNTKGVYDHGRVSINEIIKEKQQSSFHIYLTDNIGEIDCISIRESALLGCIPLITPEGVFRERHGMFYKIDRSESNEIRDYEEVANKISNLANDDATVKKCRQIIKKKAIESEPSWKEVADAWLENILT